MLALEYSLKYKNMKRTSVNLEEYALEILMTLT